MNNDNYFNPMTSECLSGVSKIALYEKSRAERIIMKTISLSPSVAKNVSRDTARDFLPARFAHQRCQSHSDDISDGARLGCVRSRL